MLIALIISFIPIQGFALSGLRIIFVPSTRGDAPDSYTTPLQGLNPFLYYPTPNSSLLAFPPPHHIISSMFHGWGMKSGISFGINTAHGTIISGSK